ncbi:MAG: hypothetical protein JWL71_4388, partial [Acidobacteria bacterium]|nr:hypothetical protein [Acidobacteriota bacterium]
ALAGPLRWGVLAVALLASVTAVLRARYLAGGLPMPGRRTVFVVSLALYLFFGLSSAAKVGPGADEPHYLVITQSLLRDHDLAIENNHVRGDYREYFNDELHPDFLRRGLNEVIYSIHAPGLPALLVPAYAAAGYRGAVVMLAIAGAVAALAVFDLAALLAGPGAALATWAAVCLTVPFVPHAWLIFPEMPGALLTAWAALWLYAPLPGRTRTWIWRGVALAILPWLHTKFIILLAAAVGALALRLWRTPKAAAALAAPAAISVALWLLLFLRLYGSLDPQVPYGDFAKLYVVAANIPRGILGLLFDQKFGLLMYAPVYLAAIAGGWMMLRRAELRLFGLALIATVAAFAASTTRMYMWWGGSSAPARFLVPIVPLLAPLIAVAFGSARAAVRAAFVLMLCASLAIAAVGVASPQRSLLFSAPHGVANMAEAVQGSAPLSFLLPTFTEEEMRRPFVLLAPWVIAALLAAAVVVLTSRVAWPEGAGAASGLVVFALAGSLLAGSPQPASERTKTTLRGRLALMRGFDGRSLRVVDYGRRARLDEGQMLRRSALSVSRAEGGLGDDPRHLAGPFLLPPGRYVARIVSAGGSAVGGTGTVMLGEHLEIGRGPVGPGAPPLTFDVPIETAVSIGVSGAALARSVTQVSLAADTIVPRSARPDVDVHAIEPIEGRPGAFIVYADEDTYREGGDYWTRGTSAGRIFVAPGGASTVMLTLHVGPTGGTIRVSVDGRDQTVTLAGNDTTQIDVPLTPGARLIPVVIQSAGEFRPSDHEPGSTDHRWLGCQVRVRLR